MYDTIAENVLLVNITIIIHLIKAHSNIEMGISA